MDAFMLTIVLPIIGLSLLYLTLTTAVKNGVRDGILAAEKVRSERRDGPTDPPAPSHV